MKKRIVKITGGYPYQRIQVSTVENIHADIQGKDFGSPSLIVIGEVSKLRNQLNFCENLDLFAKKILVTRARSQASSLCAKLTDLGAEVIEAPCIDIREKVDENFTQALKGFKENIYSHLVIHSVNGREIFFKNFLKGQNIRDLVGVKICSIGKMTSKLIRSYGLQPDIEPDTYIGEELLDAIKRDLKNCKDQPRFFVPHSNLTREKLLKGYKDLGSLDSFVVYENKLPDEKVSFDKVDYILFTSSSTVENFIRLYGKEATMDAKIVSIGDITSKTIEKNGLYLYGQSDEATIDSLIEFLREDRKNENEKN